MPCPHPLVRARGLSAAHGLMGRSSRQTRGGVLGLSGRAQPDAGAFRHDQGVAPGLRGPAGDHPARLAALGGSAVPDTKLATVALTAGFDRGADRCDAVISQGQPPGMRRCRGDPGADGVAVRDGMTRGGRGTHRARQTRARPRGWPRSGVAGQGPPAPAAEKFRARHPSGSRFLCPRPAMRLPPEATLCGLRRQTEQTIWRRALPHTRPVPGHLRAWRNDSVPLAACDRRWFAEPLVRCPRRPKQDKAD